MPIVLREKDQKNHAINIRLKEKEYKKLARIVKKEDISISAYVRSLILKTLGK